MTKGKQHGHNAPTRRRAALIFAVCVFLFVDKVHPLKWLGVYNEKEIAWTNSKICRKMRDDYGLSGQQTKLCKEFSDSMPHVHQAANLAISMCQTLFQYRKWNCSLIKALPDPAEGTKEQALIYALTSAALTYTIARGCAKASISNCGCSTHPDEPPDGNFKWGGCGDNVDWGIQFSRQFMEINKRPKRQRRENKKRRRKTSNSGANVMMEHKYKLMEQINSHNSKIGRELVFNSMIKQCKCHGVSGSCSIKTCWRGLPYHFSEIGDRIMRSYLAAIEVYPSEHPLSLSRFNNVQSLLYMNESPDYCERDLNVGSIGTSGRVCKATTDDHTSCKDLCCGRGYRTSTVTTEERCNCKYVACCYVQCNYCNVTKDTSICN